MTADEFRSLTSGATFPLTIRTRGGKEYTVRTANSFWISEEYPDTVLLARTGESIVFVAINAIDSVQPAVDSSSI